MTNYVVITGGGSGKRMGTDLPKQFLTINDKPIILHTIDRFLEFDRKLKFIFVLPEAYITYMHEMLIEFSYKINYDITAGGKERFNSVKNGLDLLENENSLVGIHDAVRPLVSKAVISMAFQDAEKLNCAIPVVPVFESLRKTRGEENVAVNRDELKVVQTPQVFNTKLLKEAYKQNYKTSFTDDAGVFESAGHKIHLIDGNTENIKITTPADISLASVYLQQNKH